MEEKKEIRILETWAWGRRASTVAQFVNMQEPPAHMGLSFPPEAHYGPIVELAWESNGYYEVRRLRERIKEALHILDNASPRTIREVQALLAGEIGEDDLTPDEEFVTISLRCLECGRRWRVIKVKGEELPPGWHRCPSNYMGEALTDALDLAPYRRHELDELHELLGPKDMDLL